MDSAILHFCACESNDYCSMKQVLFRNVLIIGNVISCLSELLKSTPTIYGNYFSSRFVISLS